MKLIICLLCFVFSVSNVHVAKPPEPKTQNDFLLCKLNFGFFKANTH